MTPEHTLCLHTLRLEPKRTVNTNWHSLTQSERTEWSVCGTGQTNTLEGGGQASYSQSQGQGGAFCGERDSGAGPGGVTVSSRWWTKGSSLRRVLGVCSTHLQLVIKEAAKPSWLELAEPAQDGPGHLPVTQQERSSLREESAWKDSHRPHKPGRSCTSQ